MATRTAMASSGDRPFKRPKFIEWVVSKWTEFTEFLSDVRAEMRKVVAPSRKEVRVTTSVVIVAVFIFGVYFAVVDWIFRVGMNSLLGKLGGMQ